MAFSRDNRLDRRRRVLRDTINADSRIEPQAPPPKESGSKEAVFTRRPANYSHSVRQACNIRLVQLIPVRWLSYIAVVLTTFTVTGGLLLAHYLIYVSGTLGWYGHPLAIALDATHPQSLAAWLGSHLWLLCLGATILIFQLRRHKLDDYNGEYRLWFWLVLICLLASIDSTTHLSELAGEALNDWATANIGFSGPALVHSTLAVLVGVLGLRLCSELKVVPTSLLFWLFGLASWAGCTILSVQIFVVDLSVQMRFWLRATLWLGGLASIWIAALAYLRHVYIEAQQRFLQRGKHNNRSYFSWAGNLQRFALPSRSKLSETERMESSTNKSSQSVLKARNKTPDGEKSKDSTGASTRWSLRNWIGGSLPEEDAQEYRKVPRRSKSDSQTPAPASVNNRVDNAPATRDRSSDNGPPSSDRATRRAAKAAEREARRAAAEAKRQARRENRKQLGSAVAQNLLKPFRFLLQFPRRLKLPSLSGFKLNPPGSDDDNTARSVKGSPPDSGGIRPEPNASGAARESADISGERPLSKAERRRLRRQDRAA